MVETCGGFKDWKSPDRREPRSGLNSRRNIPPIEEVGGDRSDNNRGLLRVFMGYMVDDNELVLSHMYFIGLY